MQLSYLGVDFTEGEKQENPEKNSRRTGETNYNKSTDTSSEHEAIASYIYTQVVTHPVIIPSYRAELLSSVVRINVLTTYAIPVLP